MRVHSLEHAAGEGAGKIADWARAQGHEFTATRLDLDEPLPEMEAVDLLAIMGGGMNIHQHRDFPWLVREKRFIAKAIAREKAMLGVCLGAQLIADVLGAKICQNPVKEIGWFPVRFLDRSPPLDGFPESCTVFHWHGDTFEIPRRARRMAESDACANQAFVYGERIVGLQFHIEVTREAAASFAAGSAAELIPACYVQSHEQLLASPDDFAHTDPALHRLLTQLAR
jgi:GMP synthase (glutamine-hydrolysing)